MVGKQFEQLIREKGVTLREVARATGISISALSKIQSGQEPKASTLHKLSKYFDCSMEFLVSGEERPTKIALDSLLSQLGPEFIEIFKDTFRVTVERKKGK